MPGEVMVWACGRCGVIAQGRTCERCGSALELLTQTEAGRRFVAAYTPVLGWYDAEREWKKQAPTPKLVRGGRVRSSRSLHQRIRKILGIEGGDR